MYDELIKKINTISTKEFNKKIQYQLTYEGLIVYISGMSICIKKHNELYIVDVNMNIFGQHQVRYYNNKSTEEQSLEFIKFMARSF